MLFSYKTTTQNSNAARAALRLAGSTVMSVHQKSNKCQRWWSQTYFNISSFLCFKLALYFKLREKKMAGPRIARKGSKQSVAEAKTARGRPKRNVKSKCSQNEHEMVLDGSANESPTKITRTKDVMSDDIDSESFLEKSSNQTKTTGICEMDNKNKHNYIEFSSVTANKRTKHLKTKYNDPKCTATNSDTERETTIISKNITSQAGMSIVQHTNRQSEEDSSIINLNHSLNDMTHNSDICPTAAKKKRVEVKKTKQKQRKLRPEDENTLKILWEKFQNSQDGAVCQVDSCKSNPLKSSKPSNLKRHLSQVHPKVYESLFPIEVSRKKQIEVEMFNAAQDAIELVTVNGYPFAMLNASGMRGFIQNRLQPIRLEGYKMSIDRVDIVKKVAEMSDKIRARIKTELIGRTVSVMFDVCTIATLSTFGVNVTYMENEEVICRSLGVIKIEKRHTAVNLADMLFDLLAKFGIPLTKVFSITTDTAKNAVNTSDILNTVLAKNNENSVDIGELSTFDIEPDDDDFAFGLDIENEIELQKIIDNSNSHTLLVQEMAEKVACQNLSIQLINQINCSTHVLQLAINDALSASDALDVIGKVKKMCLLLRTQVVIIEIRKLGSKIILPPLDNVTRWNSKFLMVSTIEIAFFAQINLNKAM